MSDCELRCSQGEACVFGCHADHENDETTESEAEEIE